MRIANRRIKCLTILSALVGVTGCVIPLPGKETTVYDSLSALQPGQITSGEVEARYGPPDLKCDSAALWIYGWSVAKGWLVGFGNGPPAQRLYHTFHVVLLWMDSDQRVIRVEVPESYSSWDTVPPQRSICTSDNTCVETRWFGSDDYRLTQDSIVESRGQVLTCSSHWGRPRSAA